MQNDSVRLKQNNFDLLRLLFAVTVCLVHTYELSGQAALKWTTLILSSEIAVEAFFVVSGILIFMSYERSRTLKSYFEKRARRIYPAYFTIVALSAVLLYFMSTHDAIDYFTFAWLKYLAANLTFLNFLHPSLPGVFEGSKFSAVNGALWTLKIEVLFYLAVPIIVLLFNRFGRAAVMLVIYSSSVFYVWLMKYLAVKTGSESYLTLAHQLPGQMTYFISGAFIYYYLPLFEENIRYFVAAAFAILAINAFWPLPFAEPISVGVLVAFFGLYGYVGNFGKYGDFSYGVYIIHFPIIQSLVWSKILAGSPYLFLATVAGLTLLGSILMWNLVEKRFLNRSSHYVMATK
jgi:peptidoglycan/LPS O-acetylase OafA/YrhL